MTTLDDLDVDLTVVLGKTRLSLQKLLRMGRGAVVAFDNTDSDLVDILANDHPIARGQIAVRGNAITIEIVELVRKAEIDRRSGATIAGHLAATIAETAAPDAMAAG